MGKQREVDEVGIPSSSSFAGSDFFCVSSSSFHLSRRTNLLFSVLRIPSRTSSSADLASDTFIFLCINQTMMSGGQHAPSPRPMTLPVAQHNVSMLPPLYCFRGAFFVPRPPRSCTVSYKRDKFRRLLMKSCCKWDFDPFYPHFIENAS